MLVEMDCENGGLNHVTFLDLVLRVRGERLNMYLQITEQDMHRCTRHGLNVCIPKVLLLFFKVGREWDGE